MQASNAWPEFSRAEKLSTDLVGVGQIYFCDTHSIFYLLALIYSILHLSQAAN